MHAGRCVCGGGEDLADPQNRFLQAPSSDGRPEGRGSLAGNFAREFFSGKRRLFMYILDNNFLQYFERYSTVDVGERIHIFVEI
jgi:hypothetical protein